MKNGKIIIIGMMGTGKTTIGDALARHIGQSWADSDAVIEEKMGKKVSAIFAEYGERYFRDLETSVLMELLLSDKTIITTGGGIVLQDKNRQWMRKHGWVVRLHCPVETIVERLKDKTDRPLLAGDLEERVWTLYQERKHLYDMADLSIDTSQCSVHEAVQTITQHVSGQ